MLKILENHIETEIPQLKGKRILIALSGGIDSMVLAHAFLQLGFQISIAHCNFQLRKESDADEKFVADWAKANKVRCFTEKFATTAFAEQNQLSIQMAARKLRYDWFEAIRLEYDFDFVATAHHLEDQLETFIINLSRGTGLDGLVGIPQIQEKVVRPMLILSKESITNYAFEHQIAWVEDASNASDKYLRNKIRHHIVPTLKTLHPTFLNNFQQTLFNLKQGQSLVFEGFDYLKHKLIVSQNGIQICDIKQLLTIENYPAFLYQWLKDYGFSAWNDIYQLPFFETGKRVESAAFQIVKEYEHLVLQPKKVQTETAHLYIDENTTQINFPLKLTFAFAEKVHVSNANTIFVDFEKLTFPLCLRKWNSDDFFYPFGMIGKKKLTHFFKDEKIPMFQKSETWVLCSGEAIIWIVGFRADNRFKVNKQTNKILQINLDS
uniref:tRNA lysidine(34) synthetase TilS n=1 Tax=Flavobacterium sp. TaxID=239 RepID=UPI00404B6736